MSATYTFPAPQRGWTETDNPVAAKGAAASVLENMLPTPTGVRLRGGCQSVSSIDAPIIAMWAYDDGVRRRLFAATETAIKDATLLDMSNAPTVVANFNGGEPVTAQFTTVGDTYQYVVNGVDDPWLFNGTTWQRVGPATTPIAITGTGADKFSHVWVFKSRVYFAVTNSMKVWALPTGQAGGAAAADLNLSGVFQKGGRILFGTSWSSDSGAGFGDRCVIVTDRGEVAIFQGSDPANAADWALVGRYEIAPPLGVNAYIKVGGDVLIATTQGLIPISGVAHKDPLALESIAVSRPISRTWTQTVGASGSGWKVVKWDNAGVILVMRPGGADAWGAYAQTGAWFKITGWQMNAAAMHNGRLYFGGADGYVKQADTTGRDDGQPFTGRFRGLLEQAPRAGLKAVQLARVWFNTTQDIRCALRFVTKSKAEFGPLPAPWTPIDPSGRWDNGLWDQMRWDSNSDEVDLVGTQWRSIGVTGAMIAPEVQVVSDSELPSVCELIAVDAIIEGGGVVV